MLLIHNKNPDPLLKAVSVGYRFTEDSKEETVA